MRLFSYAALTVSLCLGAYHIYARSSQTARQQVSSITVSAQFYHKISMLAQNLTEAELLLYANHRVDEKLLHLVTKGARQSTLTSGVAVPPRITLGMILPLGDGKEVNLGTRDPQELLDLIAGQDFITALKKLHRWHQQQLKHLEKQTAYRIDFHKFVDRRPHYAFMLHDKEAILLKRRAADRILASLGMEAAAWEELPTLNLPERKIGVRGTLDIAVLEAKDKSADFYYSLESLTQEFLQAEHALYQEYEVERKVREYLLWKGINGEFYGGTLNSITRDNMAPHDLLSLGAGPDYIAELEVLYTDYLEKAAELEHFWEHAEHTRIWNTDYAEMYAERRIAFKLKRNIVDKLIADLKSITISNGANNSETLQP